MSRWALRRWTGVRFVRRAPTRRGGTVRLRVSPMQTAHIAWWHAHVQPSIDRDPERADSGWNWFLYLPFTLLAGAAVAHQPAGYAVGMVADHDGGAAFVPCALVLLVARSRALDDPRQRSAFVWYLTTAPAEALLDVPDLRLDEEGLPRRLGTIALDVAVSHSFNMRRHGRVALYASRKGGDRLLAWYRKRGMEVFAEDEALPFGVRSTIVPNDGRYCYYTVPKAVEASRSLDSLR